MKNKRKKERTAKDAVNRKSSIIFIQLGLVFALFLTYIAIESKTIIKDDGSQANFASVYDMDDTFIPDTTPEPPKPKKVEVIPEPIPILDDPIILKDDSKEKETVIDIVNIDPDKPVKIDLTTIIEIPIIEEDPEDVPFKDIKNAPIFPGCKGTKEEMKKCFSSSINKLVAKKFNIDLAQELGLSDGKKKIRVQFVVDKNGDVTDVKIRAPHKRLEKETRRVISLLPKMIAGKQRGREVGVKFYLPITFIVQ